MQYRTHRYPTQFPIEIRTPIGPQRGSVIDVNTTGVRISGMRHLRRGDKVKLSFLAHQVDAVVQWASDDLVGLAFRPRITDDQVDTLRYRRDGRIAGRRCSVGFAGTTMR